MCVVCQSVFDSNRYIGASYLIRAYITRNIPVFDTFIPTKRDDKDLNMFFSLLVDFDNEIMNILYE